MKKWFLKLKLFFKNLTKEQAIMGFVLLVCLSCSVFYKVYTYLEEEPRITSTKYLLLDSDALFKLDEKKLEQVDKFVVLPRSQGGGVGDFLGNYRDIFVKFKGKNDIDVYTRVSKEAYEEYSKTFLDRFRNNHKDFEIVYTSSLDLVNKPLDVKDAPTNMIVDSKTSAVSSVVFSILGQILVFGLLFAFLIHMQKGATANTITKVKPKDLTDDISDLKGMKDIIDEVLQVEDMFLNKELYEQYNANKPFNILFTGPAGVGKTKLARCLSKRLDLPMFYCSAASLQSGYVGGGSNTLKKLMKAALKCKRAIIFLDEAESLLQDRLAGAQHWEKDTIGTLLSLLDGVTTKKNTEIIWILASNMNDTSIPMDAATLRRLPLKIHFRLPNFEERKEIFDSLLAKIDKNKIVSDLDTSTIASLSTGISPAIIETIVNRASLIAIKRGSIINQNILMEGFERVMLGLTDRQTLGNSEEQRLIVARHEIGHFIVSFDAALKRAGLDLAKVRDFMDVIKISTESVSHFGALGFVFSKEKEVKLQTRNQYELEIKKLYGGMASEEMYNGEAGVTAGAQNDIEKISKLLGVMIGQIGFYQDSKLNYKALSKTEELSDEQLKLIEEKSKHFYNETLSILNSHRPLMDRLVDKLMESYVLSIDDALAIVSDYYNMQSDNTIIVKSDNIVDGDGLNPA